MVTKHDRAFHVARGRDFLELRAVGKRLEAGEIFFQAADVAMPPSAIDEVRLSVVIAKYKRIDRLCTMIELADQRFAQIIPERALRTIGHRDADAARLVIALNIIGC